MLIVSVVYDCSCYGGGVWCVIAWASIMFEVVGLVLLFWRPRENCLWSCGCWEALFGLKLMISLLVLGRLCPILSVGPASGELGGDIVCKLGERVSLGWCWPMFVFS